MEAIRAFNKTLERSDSLLALHRSISPTGRPSTCHGMPDILRAIIVLSVAALDSYFHDKLIENLMRVVLHCGKRGDGLPGALKDALGPKLNVEKAITMLCRSRWDEEIRRIMADHLSVESYQNPRQIEKGLKLLGIDDLWEPLRLSLSLSSKQKAKEYVIAYVTRRNQIVHEGDLYKSKKYRHKLRHISRPFAEKCISCIKEYVGAINGEIDMQVRAKYPSN